MNELAKIKQRILERIEIYIADIELVEELTEDEKTIFASVKNIILEEFDKASLEAPLPRFIWHADGRIEQVKTSDETHECDTEQIIKDTIKEYIDKDCDDVTELLLALSKDLCERIRKEC